MSEPLVSVVTPFYNTAPFLTECIESVCAQDYDNWEYILADNRSDDGSEEIARRHASRDERIRYVREDEFVGQVPNYNRALRRASDDAAFVKIVQADDWLYPQCIGRMVEAARSGDSVELVGAYGLVGRNVAFDGLATDRTVREGREVCRKFFVDDLYVFGSPTNVMYSGPAVRSREPFYREGLPFEDAEVCFEILKTGQFAFVPQVLTFTRRQAGSLWDEIERCEPRSLMRLVLSKRHADDVLPEERAEEATSRARRDHARVMARSLLRGGRGKCWSFHVSGREAIDENLPFWRLGAALVSEVLDRLGNPLDTLRRAGGWLRRRGGATGTSSRDGPERP